MSSAAADGIRAQTNGNGNVTVTTGAGATITAITGISLYGIEAFSNGQGNISVTTASGDFIFSGSVGINAYNQATSIPQVDGLTNSSISVTAYGTINSGTTYTGGAADRPEFSRDTGEARPTRRTPTAFGNVTVNNFATINAAGGDGIRAYNYGPGNVTINNNAAAIVAQRRFWHQRFELQQWQCRGHDDCGSSITSGSHGILAINQATTIAAAAGSTVTVTSNGTINSGVHLTGGVHRRRAFRLDITAATGLQTRTLMGRCLSIMQPTSPAGLGMASLPLMWATATSRSSTGPTNR